MGGSDSKVSDEKEDEPSDELENGPVKNRQCTDICCVFLYLAHIIGFVVLMSMGFVGGNPARLTNPRDFAGNYCGLSVNWNNGPDLSAHGKLLYMMNVSSTVEPMLEQMLCSSQVDAILSSLWSADQAKLDNYRCECCLTPCKKCEGSGTFPVFSSPSDLAGSIQGRMSDLTNPANAMSLWSNGLSGMMAEASKYFVQSCATSCASITETASRKVTYTPFPDSKFYSVYQAINSSTRTDVTGLSTIKDTLTGGSFEFDALPKSQCPYDAQYCVPFPGVVFTEATAGYCTFKLNSVIQGMVDGAFDGLSSAATGSLETIGSAFGDAIESIDTLAVVCVLAFCIGFFFLILLRFCVGLVVWMAVLFTLALFFAVGLAAYVRSFQCAGSSFDSSVAEFGVALGGAAQSGVSGQAAEGIVGNGETYRGFQARTRTGRDCQAWSSNTPHSQNMVSQFPDAGLTSNYCRNPGGNVISIWCFTTDPETRWDLCTPIGQVQPTCNHGYAVQDEVSRKALEICAYVVWGLGGIFFLCVCFLQGRIRLAIALNKAAAQFVMAHPMIVLVPVVQALIGVLWLVMWSFVAAFLISKVSDGAVPTDAYATYAEAYGTPDTPGKCTGTWPTGSVWRTFGDPTSTSDPCSGNLGVAPATPKCWRCAPPRYAITWETFYAVFTLLWNNAFLIAAGQMIVAGACGAWFFAKKSEKGKNSAIKQSLKNTFFYHLGTLAFGSFVLALVQFIRFILKYFEKQAKAQKNKVLVLLLKCVACCIWCFEKCIQFLNKNAYIQTALLGTPFCTSAKKAFQLILRNALRFGVVTSLAGMVGNLGLFFIMAATGTAGYFIQLLMHSDVNPVLPICLYVIVGYVVGKLFMNVFGLSVSTMLQCVIAAEEMGGGDFVPPVLANVLDNKGSAGKSFDD